MFNNTCKKKKTHHINRKAFLRKKRAALVIQKHWRGHKGRKLFKKVSPWFHVSLLIKVKLTDQASIKSLFYLQVQLGFNRLQALVRSRQLQHQYKKKREAVIKLQAQTRGYLARKERRRKTDAVIVLQAYTRGLLARNAAKMRKRHVGAILGLFPKMWLILKLKTSGIISSFVILVLFDL